MNKRETYTITLTRPDGVSVQEMKDYISEAVSIWCRGGDPEAPIWEVRDHPVKVTRQKPNKENIS